MQCLLPGEGCIWLAQLRRGAVERCVLALLRRRERYGLELARTLADTDGPLAGEGTIYPLLARLRRNGLVEPSWRESADGPPRRYYRLTELGELTLSGFMDHWKRFRDGVDAILPAAWRACKPGVKPANSSPATADAEGCPDGPTQVESGGHRTLGRDPK